MDGPDDRTDERPDAGPPVGRILPADLLARTSHRPWPLPTRSWVQRQSWLEFAFLHWPVPVDVLRPLVPEPLELDLADGVAWVGVIPFRMTGVTLRGLPDIPGFSAFHELNVRTYVRFGGKAGVYFLSLDANQRLAVRVARAWYGLPYWDALLGSTAEGPRRTYHSQRVHPGGGDARLSVTLSVGAARGPARPGTLEHWLAERYALLLVRRGVVYCGDVHHLPWPLTDLAAEVGLNTMTAPLGLPLSGPPAHTMYSPGVDTVVWSLSRAH
jgi:uncharacterized protein